MARAFPPFHLAEGLQLALAGSGTGLSAGHLAMLAAWGLAALAVASRRFRWEPQGGGA